MHTLVCIRTKESSEHPPQMQGDATGLATNLSIFLLNLEVMMFNFPLLVCIQHRALECGSYLDCLSRRQLWHCPTALTG